MAASFLCNAGADVNAQTKDGFTPLHFAVTMNDVSIVKELLMAKADTSISCKQGTALEIAMKGNLEEMVEVLKVEKREKKSEK